MAKPDHTWTGSSGHLHMSIWDADGKKGLSHNEADGLPYGMSRQFSQFVAGMMALSRELAVFVAPFINSYKRYASLSWAPVNVVWGRDNRTTGFRLVGRGPSLHIENRFPGGDMNAYLTYAAMVGAGLGFLWFNSYPANVFMGDTGSLALGGAIGVVAILIKKEFLLFLVGGVFVLEAASVLLQVAWFKSTGKRLFLMSPLHHHFERLGWPEPKVTIRFWIVAIALALLSLATLKLQ